MKDGCKMAESCFSCPYDDCIISDSEIEREAHRLELHRLARQRNYRRHKDVDRANCRLYRLRHRDRLNDYQRRYREQHREEMAERQRKYYWSHHEAELERARRDRRKGRLAKVITQSVVQEIELVANKSQLTDGLRLGSPVWKA